jgi:hypothetical protein
LRDQELLRGERSQRDGGEADRATRIASGERESREDDSRDPRAGYTNPS